MDLFIFLWSDEGGQCPFRSADGVENFEFDKSVNFFMEAFFVFLWDAVRGRLLWGGKFLQFHIDWWFISVAGFGFEERVFLL